jgi:hypothetical protein
VREQDSAGRQAREVVGLYGDPDTTWGICLELGFASPLGADQVRERASALVAGHPHLGPGPVIVVAGDEEWDLRREEAAAAPYDVVGPLVRLLLSADGHRLLVAAHHGACDGLGLVAIAESVSGAGLVSAARGIGDRPSPLSFTRSSIARLNEAVLRPPPRFVSHVAPDGAGEHLRVLTLPRRSTGTVDLCVALADVFTAWNHPGSGNAGRPLFVSGASRRPPGTLAPDRQTAYLRFRVDPSWDRDRVRAEFGALAPEPEFPETSVGGVGPRITRLLRARLGATAQLSNLGVVEATELEYAAMFPALSGPRGLAVGLVTTSSTTTLSLRTRGSEFSAADTDQLLGLIAARL